MTLEIRETTDEAVAYLADNLRSADEVEVILLTGKLPEEALRESVESSVASYVGYFNGVPGGIFGVGKLTDTVGVPWMVGTDLMTKHSREWLVKAPKMLWWMHNQFPVLTNIVHMKNYKSIKWLHRLGFEFSPEPVKGFPDFIQFHRCNNV